MQIEFLCSHDKGSILSFELLEFTEPPKYCVRVKTKKEIHKQALDCLTYVGSYPKNPDNCIVWPVESAEVHSERKGDRILANTLIDLILKKHKPDAFEKYPDEEDEDKEIQE